MSDSVNLREIVLDLLIEVNEKNQYSHIVLSQALNKFAYLEKQERSFVTRLFEGCLEKSIELDYVINQFSKTKTDKMKPLIRNLLRMGAYQIMYMDGVPESAACNESVKLAKKRGFHTLSGFVNGVLRAIARNRDNISYPSEEKSPEEYYSVKYSMPQWLIKMWTEQFGTEKLVEILEGFNGNRKTFIRCNTLKCSPDEVKSRLEKQGVVVKAVPDIDFAFEIDNYDSIGGLESFNKGMFYVQDVSSIMAGIIAQPKEGDTIIDMCAAPGGKSINAYLLANGKAKVNAYDISEYKTSMIMENVERLGLDKITADVRDATQLFEDSIGKADLVIADVPCSGLGVLSRKNDIRTKMTGEMIDEIVLLQRKILKNASLYVKTGGTLVFSTCTINKKENQENVEWLLANTELKEVSQLQILPGQMANDGFFIAKFVKKGACHD